MTAAKRLFCIISNEYGYKGKEIAAFLWKDPAIVTKHLKERTLFDEEVLEVIKKIEQKKD